jgi:hypothetical protein
MVRLFPVHVAELRQLSKGASATLAKVGGVGVLEYVA